MFMYGKIEFGNIVKMEVERNGGGTREITDLAVKHMSLVALQRV